MAPKPPPEEHSAPDEHGQQDELQPQGPSTRALDTALSARHPTLEKQQRVHQMHRGEVELPLHSDRPGV